MQSLLNWWGSVSGAVMGWASDSAEPSLSLLVVSMLVGAVALNAKPQWATIPHELGHAFVALILGKRLEGINIRRDSTGDAVTSETLPPSFLGRVFLFPFRWVRSVLVSLGGYCGPFLYAWAVASLLAGGYSAVGVALTFFLLCFTLLYVRNGFGFLLVVTGVLLVGALLYVDYEMVNQGFSAFLVGGMLAGGGRGVWEAWRVYQEDLRGPVGEAQHSDARALAQRTLIPQVVWLAFFTGFGVVLSALSLGLLFF